MPSIETSIIYQVDSKGNEALMYVVSQETSSLHNALPLAKRLKKTNPDQNVVMQLWSDDSMNWEIYEDEFMQFPMSDDYRDDIEADVNVFVVVRYGNGDGDCISNVIVEDERSAIYHARSEKQEWKYWTMRIEVWRAGRRERIIHESDMGIEGTKILYHRIKTVRDGLEVHILGDNDTLCGRQKTSLNQVPFEKRIFEDIREYVNCRKCKELASKDGGVTQW